MSLTQEPTISPEPEPEPELAAGLASVTNLATYRASKEAARVDIVQAEDNTAMAALRKEFWDEGRFWERRDTRRNMIYGTTATIAILGIYEYMRARGR